METPIGPFDPGFSTHYRGTFTGQRHSFDRSHHRATSGVGYAAARILAGEGWREIIVTGRKLAVA
jgi:hypothetical protein